MKDCWMPQGTYIRAHQVHVVVPNLEEYSNKVDERNIITMLILFVSRWLISDDIAAYISVFVDAHAIINRIAMRKRPPVSTEFISTWSRRMGLTYCCWPSQCTHPLSDIEGSHAKLDQAPVHDAGSTTPLMIVLLFLPLTLIDKMMSHL